jgi:hypothetical protein
VAPLLKLMERAVCVRVYGVKELFGEGRCQGVEVQREVARIRGWKSAGDGIVGMWLSR